MSAASIVAKVERESDIATLKDEFGDFGSGYTSDESTIAWLRAWLKEKKKFPESLVRESWVTASVLKAEREQTTIAGWFRGVLGSGPQSNK